MDEPTRATDVPLPPADAAAPEPTQRDRADSALPADDSPDTERSDETTAAAEHSDPASDAPTEAKSDETSVPVSAEASSEPEADADNPVGEETGALDADTPDEDAVADDVEEEEEDVEDVAPIEVAVADEEEATRDWYILKVQSNREESIRDALLRRVAVAGMEEYFGDVIVPTEMVSEFRGGKKRVVKRKLYPGYIVVNMVINDDTWFLVRDTPGVGDFTGSGGRPSPMLPHEVSRILVMESDETKEKGPKPKISFSPGDRVKINEGTFENFEGDVDALDEANGRVTVMINIFGRSTPVELEYWQVESL